MAAGCLSNSVTSQNQLNRTLEKVLNEAQLTGELRLSGRKLKEFPKIASQYELVDTVYADISKNRFSELPNEVTEYGSLEVLDLYHNVIRSIPDTVSRLHSLTQLTLSRNHLTTLPPVLCQLPLQVLLVSHNKLVSVPEEIGQMSTLHHLDISCNEIQQIPPHIGDLPVLRALSLRRNQLVEVPAEISFIKSLVKLDLSSNRLSVLPIEMRQLKSLVELRLEHNPLSSPPSHLCTRGKVHVFKYLDRLALREERKRGVLGGELKRVHSSPCRDFRFPTVLDTRWKRNTVDSGYNTSDGGDKRWSGDSQDASKVNDPRRLPFRADLSKSNRVASRHAISEPSPTLRRGSSFSSDGDLSTASTPSTLSPGESTNLDPDKEESEEKRMEKILHEEEREERRRAAIRLLDQQREEARELAEKGRCNGKYTNGVESSHLDNNSDNVQLELRGTSLPHIQTYKEYKEALKQQRAQENGSVYSRKASLEFAPSSAEQAYHPPRPPGPSSAPPMSGVSEQAYHPPRPPGPSSAPPMSGEEEFKWRHATIMQQHRKEAHNVSRMVDDQRKESPPHTLPRIVDEQRKEERKQQQRQAVLSFIKSRTSPVRSPSESSSTTDGHPGPPNGATGHHQNGGHAPTPPHNQQGLPSSPRTMNGLTSSSAYNTANPSSHLNFTMRREFEKAKEEYDKIEDMRRNVESRLKVSLPEDLPAALTDGVVLCHLANHTRPRSVSSIHVPNPAVPKLTMAKCRRNVENFLDACRKIGVDEELLCSPADILEEKSPIKVAITVSALLRFQQVKPRA